MKTNVKLLFRASQGVPKQGKLVIRITRHRATTTISTSCVLFSDEWEEDKQMFLYPKDITPKRKKELATIERKLKRDLKTLYETIELLETRGDYSTQEVAVRFRERRQGQMFCAYVYQKSEKLRAEGHFSTAHIYRYAKVSFFNFLGNKDIRIDKITSALIKDYEQYLLSMYKSKNTISCYMRALRAAFNRALREKIFTAKKSNENPFSEVFTGNAKTRKRAIGGESISRLVELELSKENQEAPKLAFFRDLFLFSFYTQGMSFADMVDLKKDNISNGFIRYERKKTGQMITIKLEDCMQEIIDRYEDKNSDFIFPILKDFRKIVQKDLNFGKWKKTGSVLTAYNRSLKKLAEMAGIDEHLTSYVPRHSWATMASQSGTPIATISRGMGHESEKTTRIYISGTDYSDVERANKKIISQIMGKPSTT